MNGRKWTNEEKEYLIERWGNTTVKRICTYLNRSEAAVLNMRTRLHLGPYLDAGDYVTINQLMIALGFIGYSYRLGTWLKRDFPMKYKQISTKKVTVVYLKDWWKWAHENITILNFSKFPRNELGEEPDWVESKRRSDQRNAKTINKNIWTEHEDRRLTALVNFHKKSISEIAIILNRSEGSIYKRLYNLNLKHPPKGKIVKWSKEEDELLATLVLTCNNYAEISKALPGRSEKAVRERLTECMAQKASRK